MGTLDILGNSTGVIGFILFLFGISQIQDMYTIIPGSEQIVGSFWFKFIAICFLIFSSIILWLKEIRSDAQYRLKDHAYQELDIKVSRLSTNNGENVFVFLIQDGSLRDSKLFKFLVCLRLKLIFQITYPMGLTSDYERHNADFHLVSRDPGVLILGHGLNLRGRRNFQFTMRKDPESSFSGGEDLEINTFISWNWSPIIFISKCLIGSRCSIKIKIPLQT